MLFNSYTHYMLSKTFEYFTLVDVVHFDHQLLGAPSRASQVLQQARQRHVQSGRRAAARAAPAALVAAASDDHQQQRRRRHDDDDGGVDDDDDALGGCGEDVRQSCAEAARVSLSQRLSTNGAVLGQYGMCTTRSNNDVTMYVCIYM